MPMMFAAIVLAARRIVPCTSPWARLRASRSTADSHVSPPLKPVALCALIGLVFLAACETPQARSERARFACYDARGRYAATITTQAECELRNWTWRESVE